MLRKYKFFPCITLLLLSLFWTRPTLAQQSDSNIFTNDQKAHAALSAAISSTLYITLRNSNNSRWSSFLGSFFLTCSIGALKEISDDKVTERDLVADAAGAFVGSLLFVSIDF